ASATARTCARPRAPRPTRPCCRDSGRPHLRVFPRCAPAGAAPTACPTMEAHPVDANDQPPPALPSCTALEALVGAELAHGPSWLVNAEAAQLASLRQRLHTAVEEIEEEIAAAGCGTDEAPAL